MSAHSGRRRGAVFLAITIAIVGGVVAAPAAYAAWSQALSAAGTASAGSLSVTATLAVLDETVENHDYQTTHVLTVTSAAPVGSAYAGNVEVRAVIDAVPATGLAPQMSVSVWPVASIGDCTVREAPGSGALSALWTAGLVSAPSVVGVNGAGYFCVRGYPTNSTPLPAGPETAIAQNRSQVAAQLGTPTSLEFSPTFGGTVQLGEFTASAAAGGGHIATYLILPFAPTTPSVYYQVFGTFEEPVENLCFDIADANVEMPNDSVLISWECDDSPLPRQNQRFTQIRVPGVSAVQIRADGPVAEEGYLVYAQTPPPNDAFTVVLTTTSNANELEQRWIPQVWDVGYLQLVNAATGECMSSNARPGWTTWTMPCEPAYGIPGTWVAVGP